MDHVVYVDAKEGELALLLDGKKRMIIRGAAGRKLPHGRVQTGDRLFFIQNNGEGLVRAEAKVVAAFHSEKLSEEESRRMVDEYQAELHLTQSQLKRWAGKRYLVLVRIDQARQVDPFAIDRGAYGNMDDWLPVGNIASVQVV